MQDCETDQSAIEEDIEREHILQKEIEDLEEQAERLESERAWRLAHMVKETPLSEGSKEDGT